MALATPPQQPLSAETLAGNAGDELEFLASGSLARRRGGGGGRLEAPQPPGSGRQFYYRQNADYDSLIEACSRKLVTQPGNVRALMIRANSYAKKGARRLCGGGRVP